MDAKEVRKGNMFFHENHGVFIVEYIVKDEVRVKAKLNDVPSCLIGVKFSELKKVPINIARLRSAGFESLPESGIWANTQTYFDISRSNKDKGWHFTDSSGKRYGKEMNFMHELQNLFFDLTGKEMNVNIKTN